VRWAFLLLSLLALAPTANAYEGAGIGREEEAPPPPPQPKLTKAPTVVHVVDSGWPAGVPFTDKPVAVVLIIQIDATGHVPKAEVKTSAGAAFDAAAQKALLTATTGGATAAGGESPRTRPRTGLAGSTVSRDRGHPGDHAAGGNRCPGAIRAGWCSSR
jgi:hypothetical protein